MARDSSRDETQKLHKKWLKHQAFMAELAQNKEWLGKIEKVSFAFIVSPLFGLFPEPGNFSPLTWKILLTPKTTGITVQRT